MTYAGLTISDKPALLDAKARGAEWVARDENGAMYGYVKKPVKLNRNHHWVNTGGNDWWLLANDSLLFIQWSDAEPVNISLAIAQIAEMESAAGNPATDIPVSEKSLTWNERINQMTVEEKAKFIDNLTTECPCALGYSRQKPCDDYEECDECWLEFLNSPYTEGENHEG